MKKKHSIFEMPKGLKVEVRTATKKPIYIANGNAAISNGIVTSNGHVGGLEEECGLIVEYVVGSGCRLHAFQVQGRQKKILRVKEQDTRPGQRFRHVRKVRVSCEDGQAFTRPNETDMRFALLHRNGVIEIWEIGMPSQDSQAYLTAQRSYNVPCYRPTLGSEIIFPTLEDNQWPDLGPFLAKLLDGVRSVPTSAPKIAPTAEPPQDLPSKSAWVKWYNLRTGVGCLVNSEGTELKAYWKELDNRPKSGGGFRYLLPGEIVTYDSAIALNDERTSFQWEARLINF